MKSGSPEPNPRLTSVHPEAAGELSSSGSGRPVETELDALMQRLAGAESALRSLRRVTSATLGLIVVGATGAGVMAAARSGARRSDRTTVRAPFRVVDARGKLLLNVDADRNGTQLRLFDGAGEPLTVLGAAPDGGTVRLSNRGGTGNLQLYTNAYGGQITLSGPNKISPVVWLGAKQEGGGLGVYDAAGHGVAWVTTARDRRGLSVGDQAGRPVAWLGAAGEGGLAIYDRSGKTAAYLTLSRGSGSLAVYAPSRMKAATLTADTDLIGHPIPGPSIVASRPANPAAGGNLTPFAVHPAAGRDLLPFALHPPAGGSLPPLATRPAAGGNLSSLALRPRTGAAPRWLLHRNTGGGAPHAPQSGAHRPPLMPLLRAGAPAAPGITSPQASSRGLKPAAPRTVIGPESEAGPRGMIGPHLEPSETGTAREPADAAPIERGGSAADSDPFSPNRSLDSMRPAPDMPAGSGPFNQKLIIAARPDEHAGVPSVDRDHGPSAQPVHSGAKANPRPRTVRRHRHSRRHHIHRAHPSGRYRRWLRHRHHRPHRTRRSAYRPARRALHAETNGAALHPAAHPGAPLPPQRPGAGASRRASTPAVNAGLKHSPGSTLPNDPD